MINKATTRIRYALRRLIQKTGYDVSRFSPDVHPLARRKQIFDTYDVDIVLDVGASNGCFAQNLRSHLGYDNRIVSFEPLSSFYQLLKANAAEDPLWKTFNLALGDTDEKKLINVAGNSVSSSLLTMLPSHLEAAPHSAYIGQEEIEIRTLDSLFSSLCVQGEQIYLKIDAQGFESKVLKGAEKSLPSIQTIQLEMSFVRLYQDELLFDEMCSFLAEKGYRLIALESGFSDPKSGQLLQVDGFFHRFE